MKPAIRCLIVDDEALAREAIRTQIAQDPELEVVGEAEDGRGATRAIESLRPDLLFLDIQIPDGDGFEVLHALMARSIVLPVTIFVTAYDTYALRAFEAHALDYLLKPIREERFKEAVSLAKSRIAADRGSRATEQLTSLLARGGLLTRRSNRLPVKVAGRILLVPLDQIQWIASEGNYVRLHLTGQTYLMRETLTALEARLDPEQFTRIHRSVIVNVDHVESLRPWFTGEYIVQMRSGKEMALTRRYRANLQRLVGREKL